MHCHHRRVKTCTATAANFAPACAVDASATFAADQDDLAAPTLHD
jgi:hypothetical protein